MNNPRISRRKQWPQGFKTFDRRSLSSTFQAFGLLRLIAPQSFFQTICLSGFEHAWHRAIAVAGGWLVVRSAPSETSQLFKAILDHLRDALLQDGAFPAQALIAILLLMSSLVRSHTLGDLARVVRKFLRLGDGQFMTVPNVGPIIICSLYSLNIQLGRAVGTHVCQLQSNRDKSLGIWRQNSSPFTSYIILHSVITSSPGSERLHQYPWLATQIYRRPTHSVASISDSAGCIARLWVSFGFVGWHAYIYIYIYTYIYTYIYIHIYIYIPIFGFGWYPNFCWSCLPAFRRNSLFLRYIFILIRLCV